MIGAFFLDRVTNYMIIFSLEEGEDVEELLLSHAMFQDGTCDVAVLSSNIGSGA